MDSKNTHRFYLNIFFFISGVCFATWTSRIPTLTEKFQLNHAELGTILIFMPFSSLMGLPVSGWLVSRFDSRIPLTFGFVAMCTALTLIGFASSTILLTISLCMFAFFMRIFNISVNTQALTVQKLFDKQINGSFHGLWSTGGIVGLSLSTLLVALHISMEIHVIIVAALALTCTGIAYKHLIRNDRAKSGNKLALSKPDPYIVYLGLLVFLAAVCEGGMFDWSGLYFKDVVKVEIFTLGYLVFMVFMATARFASDKIIERIGMSHTYLMSAFLICAGISLAVLYPYFWTSMLGFCIVGFGTAPVIPMTYQLAGTSRKYSPGLAISVLATYGIVGTFIGPPMIGYISHAFNLKVSFIAFAVAGVMLIPVSQLFFRHRKKIG
jgi:MFS family permease